MTLALCLSCDNKDHKLDSPLPLLVSNGVYVICGGDTAVAGEAGKGAVTYYLYSNGNVVKNWFEGNIGRALPAGATDGLAYGDKLYIAIPSVAKIEVVNRKTRQAVGQIDVTELMGSGGNMDVAGTCRLAAADGVLYIAARSGVAAVDTTSFRLLRTYATESRPVDVAVTATNLYVCSLPGTDGAAPSVQVIPLSSSTAATVTSPLLQNPSAVVAATPYAFVLDSGSSTVASGVRRLSGSRVANVAEATLMCLGTTKLYYCNAMKGSTTATCSVYDLQTDSRATFVTDGVFAPCLMGADPVNGHLFIASYTKDPQTGQPAYGENCQVTEYDTKGAKVKTFDTGVNPVAFVFDTALNYVEY